MAKKQTASALSEKPGIVPPDIVSAGVAREIIQRRGLPVDLHMLVKGILEADIGSLSRAITLVESTKPEHLEKATAIINACLPHSGNSIRIGITGVPGVGKSTFIEVFGTYLTGIGKKVAVLAVDPSSTVSHGSILGDKTRMEALVKDPNAYIRPSASGENLGGVTRKTRETITLCEAAGFDTIIIETVGVGQSETAVHGMVDFFLLLQIAGAGDELQGIKRGIIEMADAIAINKSDADNIGKARLAKTEFSRALHLYPAKASGWQPKVDTCSALTKEGIPEIWVTISEYIDLTKENGWFDARRNEQNQHWLKETIDEQLRRNFYDDKKRAASFEKMRDAVQKNELSPFAAAQALLKKYFGN